MDAAGEVSFGEWLKRRRNALGLTQEQLALRISCSTITLRKIEAEERRPSPQIVEQLAGVFNVPPAERVAFLRFARGDWRLAPAAIDDDLPWRAAPASPRSNLPASTTSFIGREKEQHEIDLLFSASRLITLTGPGGVGKTRLVLEIARQRQAYYADSAWFVELAPLAQPELVPRAVAATLGVREVQAQPLIETLARYLKSRSLLLVLDNCEHLIDACARLADELLRACPGLQLLTTSREPLHIAGEFTWQVSSLSLPDPQHLPPLEDLDHYEAVRLFTERARAALPSFELTAQNAGPVAQVCYRLDGIPLALELAAARINVLTIEQILDRLSDRFTLLTAGNRTALNRQQTLRATLDWSYELLSEPERLLFRRLAVFAGGWDLEAGETICALPQLQVLDLLSHLVDKCLVVADPRPGQARYRMLETIRDYARQRLDEAAETRDLSARHSAWCIALAEAANSNFWGTAHLKWASSLDAELGNLRAALAWCLAEDIGSGLRLASSLWQFWILHGHLIEGHQWLESVLQRIPVRDARRAQALESLSMVQFRLADANATLRSLQESFSVHMELGDKLAACRARQAMGAALVVVDRFGEARAALMESMSLADEVGCAACHALCTHFLGIAAWGVGELPQAWDLLQEGLAQLQELPDAPMVAHFFLNLTHGIGVSVGYEQRAASVEEETILVLRDVSLQGAIAYCLANMGELARHQADYAHSREFLESSLAQFRAIGDQMGVGQVLAQLGNLAKFTADFARARRDLEDSLQVRRDIGDQRGIGRTLNNLANLALLEDDLPRARALLAESTDLFQGMKDKPGIAATLSRRGDLAMAERDFDRAESIYMQSIAAFRELGVKYAVAVLWLSLARCARLRGDRQAERFRLKSSLALFTEIGHRPAEALIRHELDNLGH